MLISFYYSIENLLPVYNIALSYIATISDTTASNQPAILLYPTIAISPKSPIPEPSGNTSTIGTLFIANKCNNKTKKIVHNSSIAREKRKQLQLHCISAIQHTQTGLIVI